MTHSTWLKRHLDGVQMALTIDDAPTMAGENGAGGDPERMDRIRSALSDLGVRDCTAFVIGRAAAEQEERLARWLDAGYLLGNHTQTHTACSSLDVDAVLGEVEACDRVLAAAGAFDRSARYFRFPYLDRGSEADRRAIHDGIEGLGYRVVHGSLDWFDYSFEAPLATALLHDDDRAARKIEDRCVAAALRSTVHEVVRAQRLCDRPVAQIAYNHFSEVSARCMPRVVQALADAGVVFCSVDEALADPVYAAFDRDPLPNGRVIGAVARRRVMDRARRVFAKWSAGAGLFRQAKLGPLWPWFE